MSAKILQFGEDFWNIRGSFKIAGIIDIGTQASLVRLGSGKFVFLDSYTLSGGVKQEIDELTNDGDDVVAVLNLHPFHTVHVTKMQEHYPAAKHYGTARHLEKFPDLNWQKLCTEDPRVHAKFSQDLEFSIPRGVDFISDDENLHFSSILAYHPTSKSIHVDDTLMYIRLPMLMRYFGLSDALSFHLTLAKVLEKREGAVQDFREWAEEMAEQWQDAENLCAAHTTTLIGQDKDNVSIYDRIIKALEKVQKTLDSHERKFG